jgi:hypothetical protein
MPSVSVSLKDFFDASALASQWPAALASNENIASLMQNVSGKAPDVAWPAALGEITRTITDLLDISLPELAAAAWGKYGVLRKYADREKYPPSESIVVPLVTHTISSVSKPYVEVLVADEPVGRVNFEVTLDLTLEGVLLTIRDGKIIAVRIGACHGKGTIRCEGVVVAQRETKSFVVPASIALDPGIPIVRANAGEPEAPLA